MIIKAVADTHALIWYVFNDARLSPFAATFMDEADADGERIGISSVTLVEIVYLIEKKRIDPTIEFAGWRSVGVSCRSRYRKSRVID
jgi:PIN domain nuclease of toxin-antitoxin system